MFIEILFVSIFLDRIVDSVEILFPTYLSSIILLAMIIVGIVRIDGIDWGQQSSYTWMSLASSIGIACLMSRERMGMFERE